ncbi:hypothetical protein [Nocardia gamkensis]|uniref:Uncharacterized protein n=1 Tax=Nocardia gamkensis TaxID=352869 RepID=A0A7X6L602_9NOCA|nr:hypothetical protein [Nocardia gamkensis]NKY28456.1 hypothetical protein [Nocardia gamkensis]NQE69161.1 hypothetical protein [Nocardia gamkensis]
MPVLIVAALGALAITVHLLPNPREENVGMKSVNEHAGLAVLCEQLTANGRTAETIVPQRDSREARPYPISRNRVGQ